MVAFVLALFGWPRLYRHALGPDLSGASPKEPAALRARRGQRTLCHLSDANGLAPGQQLSQLFLGDCERGTQRNGLKKGVEAFLILPCSSFLVPRSPVGSLVFSRVCWNQHGSGIEARTREGIAEEPEVPQVRQVPDRLWDPTCTSRERATGTIRERSPFPSSRSPVLSSLSPV